MDLREVVCEHARTMGLLDEGTGDLRVSSLSVVEFVMALEDATGVEVPNGEMLEANFKTVTSVVAMLERLRGTAG
jgi:acyl carrier protein